MTTQNDHQDTIEFSGTIQSAQKKKPFKKIVCILIAAVLVVCIVIGAVVIAPYIKKKPEPAEGASSAAEEVKQHETTRSETEATGSAQTDTAWIAAYKKYLLDRTQQISEETEELDINDPVFSLIYLDEDAVPELVVSEESTHLGHATLVTFYEGKLRTFSDLGSYGGFRYKKWKGIVVSGYDGSGSSSETVYLLKQGVLEYVWSCEFTCFDAYSPRPTEDGGEHYYTRWSTEEERNEVSKAEYLKEYETFVPRELSDTETNGYTAPKLTRRNVEVYFNALADRSSVTTIRTYSTWQTPIILTLSGTASEIKTDFRGDGYIELIIDEPILLQFDDNEFPSLLRTVYCNIHEIDPVPSGHATITGEPYRDENGKVWVSVS